MNFTNDYHDELEGDSLACNPNSIAEGLAILCTFGMPMIGCASLFNGLWCFRLVYIQRRHRKLTIAQMPHVRKVRKAREHSHKTNTFSYMDKLLLSIGGSTIGLSLMLLVNGAGTMYSRNHIRGQIGDAVGVITYATWWYNSLLQHRGAIYFKSSILKQGSNRQIKSSSRFNIPTPYMILDIMQSWLAPIIALALWGLLFVGVYTRGWYMFYMIGLTGCFGLRTFVYIVIQRLTTLQHVASAINSQTGTREEKRQWRGIVVNKTTSIIIDLGTVFCTSVLSQFLIIFLGSTFNSEKFAIHGVILNLFAVVTVALTNGHINSSINNSRRKSGILPKRKSVNKGNIEVKPVELPPNENLSLDASTTMEESEV